MNYNLLTMKNTTKPAALATELAFLRTVLAAHKAKVDDAYDAMDAQALAFEQAWGFCPSQSPEHAPGYVAAKAAYEALSEDSGYFWTHSRRHDLEMMVEGNAYGQLSLLAPPTLAGCCVDVIAIGHMPIANEAVAPFIAQTLGYAVAA